MDTTKNPAEPAVGGGQTDADGNQTNSGRTAFATGSTTQGGSNHGQGSHDTGGSPYRQGSEGNAGANYDNEVGTAVGDSTTSGTDFGGALPADTGQNVAGDSYGRGNLPGNAAEAAGAGQANAGTNTAGASAQDAPVNLAAQPHREESDPRQDTGQKDRSVDEGFAGSGDESGATSAS